MPHYYRHVTFFLPVTRWPRSLERRLETLRNSSLDLPLSIILLVIDDLTDGMYATTFFWGNPRPAFKARTPATNHPPSPMCVGHARLKRVTDLGVDAGVLVESVVVANTRRGQGWGRVIMEHVGEVARDTLGMTSLHLCTKDKQGMALRLSWAPSRIRRFV